MSTPRFLKGPIPYAWLAVAAALPGKAMVVGVVIWTWAGIHRRHHNIPISLSKMPVERMAASRGLAQLEKAGLVTVRRLPGRMTSVTLASIPASWHQMGARSHSLARRGC